MSDADPGTEPRPRRWRAVWMTVGVALTVSSLVAGSLVVTTVWAVVQASSESTSGTQSFPRTPARIEANVGVGAVTVTGHGAQRVDVERDLTWSHTRPTVDETWAHDTFDVDVECGNGPLPWVNLHCSADYRATVPRDAAADVRTSTAPIEVRDLVGGVEAWSSTGEVAVDSVGGPLKVRTSTGGVDGTALRSDRTDTESSSGDVTLRFAGPPKRVTAETSTGDVTVEVPRGSGPYQVDVDTSTGDRTIDVATDPAAERVIDLSTSTGDVQLRYS